MSAVLPPLLLRGDCLVELKRIPDASVDAVVTDPPYGLSELSPQRVAKAIAAWVDGESDRVPDARGFMGHAWDAFVPPPAVWDECYRILKPGGHLLAFAGSRTQDLMGLSVRLAGFEIRDSIAWLYGSGFPKSMDVSKAIDKAAGAQREVIGKATNGVKSMDAMNLAQGKRGKMYHEEATYDVTAPATDAAREWEGWGTALKPAFEPIVVARRPLIGTVAANVLEHGTGALNIDATRIHTAGSEAKTYSVARTAPGAMQNATGRTKFDDGTRYEGETKTGRWPANVALDESQAAALDEQSGVTKSPGNYRRSAAAANVSAYGKGMGAVEAGDVQTGFGDLGGASRFFYVAKAPKSERPVVDGVAHPTVKPLALMRWLCRLVTPPGGVVVDPFAGSGTTLEAAYLEGFESIGVEMTPEYWPLIAARIERVTK